MLNARRFLFISLGILALSIAYHLGGDIARADRDDSNLGAIRLCTGPAVVSQAGEMWVFRGGGGTGFWERFPLLNPPVPTSEIKFYESGGQLIITRSDEAWWFSNGNWANYGAPPLSPTPTKSPSWGQLKGGLGK